MKITNRGFIDSGYGTAGYRAFRKGKTWEEALKQWEQAKHNSLWVKAALRAFHTAGGFVPDHLL
jgi:hypothetical protein